ncbi:MAG: hypothetical protein LQ344_005042 [Seirophora lacunosa]|nr:MAG: hypothetical protein LQ344_005042 [Seirophora lacunosa]
MARSKVKASQDLRSPSSEKPMTRKRARLEAEHDSKEDANDKRQSSSAKRQKPQTSKSVEEDPADEDKAIAPSSTKERTSKPTAAAKQDAVLAKVESLISMYGKLPLADLELPNSSESTPENVLALVYNAMLTSARISHELAFKSVKCLVEAGYQDIATLSKSTWEERTEVLTKGGYTRYREKTATGLGELADFVKEKYDSDLNNLLKAADSAPSKIRTRLKEIKGIGNVGLDIFCDTAQQIWPCLAPFLDPRSMKTAQQCGLGDDVDKIWQAVGEDPERMCRLAAALTTVRLEKKEKEFS